MTRSRAGRLVAGALGLLGTALGFGDRESVAAHLARWPQSVAKA